MNLGVVASIVATDATRRTTAPELALATFQERNVRQAQILAGFTARSVISATLSSTSQGAELEVESHYVAPRTLRFTQIRSTGDAFVTRNVIFRVLQSEVDQIEKTKERKLAINSENYIFTYRSTDTVDGHCVYIYSLKPRRKLPGLFKGEIYLHCVAGKLLRVKGIMVKSPSFFIKRIEFDQQYQELEEYIVPVRLHAVIKTHVVGKVILDILTDNYAFESRLDSDGVLASKEPELF